MLHTAAKTIIVTPVITATGYTTGQQVGGINLLSEAVAMDGGTALLRSLCITDKAKQSIAADIYLFSDVPTLISVDTGTFDMSDAQNALNCIGSINMPAASYAASNSNSVCTVNNIGMLVQSRAGKNAVALPTGASKRDLWFVVVTRGSATYTSVSDLCLKFGFEQH